MPDLTLHVKRKHVIALTSFCRLTPDCKSYCICRSQSTQLSKFLSLTQSKSACHYLLKYYRIYLYTDFFCFLKYKLTFLPLDVTSMHHSLEATQGRVRKILLYCSVASDIVFSSFLLRCKTVWIPACHSQLFRGDAMEYIVSFYGILSIFESVKCFVGNCHKRIMKPNLIVN